MNNKTTASSVSFFFQWSIVQHYAWCGNRSSESNELRENMQTIIEAHAAILLLRQIETHVVILNC